jgi:hypothetical protein
MQRQDEKLKGANDDLAPILASGEGRETPLLGARRFTELVSVVAAGESEPPVHVMEVESRVEPPARHSAVVKATVGTELTRPRAELEGWLKERIGRALATEPRISEVVAGESYLAADLSATPDPGVEVRALRRKFLMLRVSCRFEAQLAGGGR